MRTKWVISVLGAIVLPLATGSAAASPLQEAAGTAFSYQGRLTEAGAPAEGAYDFEFKLFDALSEGSQVGSTITREDVSVSAGLFTVQLDFGDVFAGIARVLEIGVRPGASVDPYTTLTPRQALSPTPQAQYAAKAPWSGLSGIPEGFADGIDDNTVYKAGGGLTLIGNELSLADSGVTSAHIADGTIALADLGMSCSSGQVIKSGGGTTWACGADNNTTYSAGTGLSLLSNQFSVNLAGTGSASTVARSDHNHWGASWSGTGTGPGLHVSGGETGFNGSGTVTGVYGYGYSWAGVQGSSTSGWGVRGAGVTGVLGEGDSVGVYGISTAAGGRGIEGHANGDAGNYAGYFYGNLAATGTKTAVVDTSAYGSRSLYAMESPENWFEDFGAGQLVSGEATISIDPMFGETVNLREDYHVFVTPLADCALYVQEKGSAGFTVRALDGQTCSTEFDYRIVAKRLGYESLRLEPADVPAAADIAAEGPR